MIKQEFMALGRRVLTLKEQHRMRVAHSVWYIAAAKEMRDNLAAWLAVSMPVAEWRREPEVLVQRDFEADELVVQLYARGGLDIDVDPSDHQAWVVEL